MKPKQRVTLILLVTVAVVVWALVSGLAAPMWAQLGQLRQEAELTQAKIAKLERLAARKPSIEQNYEAYGAFRSDEPESMTQRGFLDELEQLAGAGNVQLNLKPRPMEQEQRVSRVVVEMDVDGTQDELLNFLDRLLAWPRLIEIERLRISASPSKEYPLRASLVVSKLIVRAQAATAANAEGLGPVMKKR